MSKPEITRIGNIVRVKQNDVVFLFDLNVWVPPVVLNPIEGLVMDYLISNPYIKRPGEENDGWKSIH